MSKTTLTLLVSACLSLSLGACKPKNDTSDVVRPTTSSADPNIESDTDTDPTPNQESINAESVATNLTTQTSANLQKSATPEPIVATTTQPDCEALEVEPAMKQINNTSKIEEVDAIKAQLNSCLPHTDNDKVIELLKSYTAMFDRFVDTSAAMSQINNSNYYAQIDDLNNILYQVEQGETILDDQLSGLNPRMQYLVKLAQNNQDVGVKYEGEGSYIFTYDLPNTADLFTPYLPDDQKAFIERMAKDNQVLLLNEGFINISFAELAKRAQFWEDYVTKYPNGYFDKEASLLFDLYRYHLFDSNNAINWFDTNIRHTNNPIDSHALVELSKRTDSQLARDAKQLLAFMELSDDERAQLYPVGDTDKQGFEILEDQIPTHQLGQALSVTNPWEVSDYADCHSGLVCTDM